MKLLFPNNLFAILFSTILPEDIKKSLSVSSAAVISNELFNDNVDVGLIPSFDLITHRDFFISPKYAISFDGQLSHSYIYFKRNAQAFKNFILRGDVSSNEVLLSRIIFTEKYDSSVTTHLDTQELALSKNDYIICGNENFHEDVFGKGISFAEEVCEMIDYPYVNYVFASKSKEKLLEFEEMVSDPEEQIAQKLPELLSNLETDPIIKEFIENNFPSLYFDLTENELEGLKELLYLPFLHGLMDDMVELNFAF